MLGAGEPEFKTQMRYYHLNIRKARLREFARLGHRYSFFAILLWLPMKLGLIPVRLPLVPRPNSINDNAVDPESLPELVRTIIRDAIEDDEKLGFIDPICECRSPRSTDGPQSLGVCVRSYHRNGRCLVQHFVAAQSTGIANREDSVVSFFDSGRAMGTTNGSRNFDSQPGHLRQFLPNAKVAELLRAYEHRLQLDSTEPLRISSRQDLVREMDAFTNRFFDYMIQRGLYEEAKLSEESV